MNIKPNNVYAMTLNYREYNKNCDTTFSDRFCDYKNLFNARLRVLEMCIQVLWSVQPHSL